MLDSARHPAMKTKAWTCVQGQGAGGDAVAIGSQVPTRVSYRRSECFSHHHSLLRHRQQAALKDELLPHLAAPFLLRDDAEPGLFVEGPVPWQVRPRCEPKCRRSFLLGHFLDCGEESGTDSLTHCVHAYRELLQ